MKCILRFFCTHVHLAHTQTSFPLSLSLAHAPGLLLRSSATFSCGEYLTQAALIQRKLTDLPKYVFSTLRRQCISETGAFRSGVSSSSSVFNLWRGITFYCNLHASRFQEGHLRSVHKHTLQCLLSFAHVICSCTDPHYPRKNKGSIHCLRAEPLPQAVNIDVIKDDKGDERVYRHMKGRSMRSANEADCTVVIIL